MLCSCRTFHSSTKGRREKKHQIVWLNYGKILSSVHILFIFIIEIKLLHMELFTEEWPFRLICYAAFHAAFHCTRPKSYIKFNWHSAMCCLVVFWSYVHILFFFWNLWETYHSHIQKRNLQFPFLFCILCSKKWKRTGAVEQTPKKNVTKMRWKYCMRYIPFSIGACAVSYVASMLANKKSLNFVRLLPIFLWMLLLKQRIRFCKNMSMLWSYHTTNNKNNSQI